MDRRTVLLMAGGVVIALALFISIATFYPFPDFYTRPEVSAGEPEAHKAIEWEPPEDLLVDAVKVVEEGFGGGDGEGAVEGFPADIAMKADYPHNKAIVQFTHAGHVDDYGSGCGDCHHNEDGEPLTDLVKGDEVMSCFECHDQPGEAPKGRDAPELTESERLQYHAEALHDNCTNCHKEFNTANNTKSAPTSCSKCHVSP